MFNRLLRNALAVLATICSPLAVAQAPQTLHYQGQLTSAGGAPVNGIQFISFKLYSSATGGAPLYQELQSVSVTNGLFSVTVGSVSPITLPFDAPYFLGITVGTDAEMTPRQPLASSAYAFRAAQANALAPTASVAGSQITGSITTATIPAANVVGATGGSGTVTSVATGAGLGGGPITSSGTITLAATNLLPTTACAVNEIAKWNGTAWACAIDISGSALPGGGAAGEVLVGSAGGPAWSTSIAPAGNIDLVTTTATSGQLRLDGTRLLHAFGSNNLFVGTNSGNFSMSGAGNAAVGNGTFGSNTTGYGNAAFGTATLAANTEGFRNATFGAFSLTSNTTGSYNAGFGSSAMFGNTTGAGNSAFGQSTLYSNTIGFNNTAVGQNALYFNTTGSGNIAVGDSAGVNHTTGNNNIAIGNDGVAGESATLRIGSAQSRAFMAGIRNVTPPGASPLPVVIDANGQLGTGSAASGGTVTSVSTGSGLTGGPITANGTIGLAATNLLPTTACAANQIAKWNGSAWACAADNTGTDLPAGGAAGQVLIGSASGPVWSNTISPSGNIELGASTAISGNIVKEGARLLYTGSSIANQNLFLGVSAGTDFGAYNTGIGSNVLPAVNNAAAQFNTGVGAFALFSLGSGDRNTALGASALQSNIAGSFNTAAGFGSQGSATGSNNTAVGAYTLQAASGSNNSAFGNNSMTANTTGANNSAFGASSLNANTTGEYNAAFGTVSLQNNTIGSYNAAFGNGALLANTSGGGNSALGASALIANTTGNANSAFGANALGSTTEGRDNSAFGNGSLFSNTANFNAAFGSRALYSNTTGTFNTAFGTYVQENTTTGNNNASFGHYAMNSNTTGSRNAAFGTSSLSSNTTGLTNVAIGQAALANNTTGNSNIAIGPSAGLSLTTGDGNIVIGNPGAAAEANTTRIGNGQTRAFIAGIRGITTGSATGINVLIDANGQLGTVSSSRNVKADIADIGNDSEVLMNLRPVSFRYKSHDGGPRQYGLIAEEVAEVAPELVARREDGSVETVYYQHLAPMLLNEAQRQRRRGDELQGELERQAARIAQLERQLASLLGLAGTRAGTKAVQP